MSLASNSNVKPTIPSDQPVHAKQSPPSLWLKCAQQIWQRLPQRLLLGSLLFVFAMFFDLYRLGQPGLWFDEAFSVELASQPLSRLWHIIFSLEPNMELYYLLLHYWLALTGLFIHPVEFVVRFPSALFAALSTVIVFLLGRRFINTLGGVLGAVLYLLNYVQLTYAQQTRAYSLQLLLICIAWYALCAVYTGTKRSRRWWAVYTLAMVLAIYSHLFSLFILLAQLVFIGGLALVPNGWRRLARQQILPFLLSLVALALLSIPMLLVSLQGSKTGWLSVPDRSDVAHVVQLMSGDDRKYLFAMALLCLLAVCIVVGGTFIVHVGRKRRKHALQEEPRRSAIWPWLEMRQYLPICWALLCWLALPFLLSYGVSFTELRLFSSRYLVVIIPPLCLLVALGVVSLRWRRVQLVVALILIVLALPAVPYYYRSAQVEDWNSTAHWLLDRYQQNDGLVCYDNSLEQGCQISMEYYLQAYPNGAHFTPDAPGAFSWEEFGPARPAGPDEAVDPKALAAYGELHPRLFFIQGRIRDGAAAARARTAQQWLDQHYRLLSFINTRTVTIRLYAAGRTS
jgi:mannosyltransferase